MSCGLGAIILVFMLVKFNVDIQRPEDNTLEEELSDLKAEEASLNQQMAAIKKAQQQAEGAIKKASQALALSQTELTAKRDAAAKQIKQRAELEEKIKAIEVAKKSDVIEDPKAGEETYVMGLKVAGRKIAVLVDRSSSMTDEVLIDVIRRKTGSDREKQAGPKWQRTKRIVRWLLARAPKSSSVQVIAYNGSAQTIGPDGWSSANDARAIGDILQDMDAIVPEGPTDLQAGTRALTRAGPTDVYVITDGLPTKGSSNYKSFNPFASCSSLWGKSNRISGECRLKLFHHSINAFSTRGGVTVNVILLPIEGDPAPSVAYWSWTSATNGLLISPAKSWP